MTRKRSLSVFTLFVYLVFSQFVVKAWVTTDWSAFSAEDFCVTKKLDTYDAKRSCRSNHNIADIDGVYDLSRSFSPSISSISHVVSLMTTSVVVNTTGFQAHAPPWGGGIQEIFLQTYIGLILLLL